MPRKRVDVSDYDRERNGKKEHVTDYTRLQNVKDILSSGPSMQALKRKPSPSPKPGKPKVSKIVVHKVADETWPDLSHYGEYSNSADSEFAIDRQERGDMGHGEFRFFNPENVENAEQAEQNYQRMESYNRGSWNMIGIYATAEVLIPNGDGSSTIQEVRSPGLWGIESDSDPSYFKEVEREELENLKGDLKALGIKEADIDKTPVDQGSLED